MSAQVLALFGPTGVGKTALALELADRLRARGEDPVAVSADALQLYRGLEVLTGAPSAAEQACLEHRLVSVLDVTETCSAGRYAALAHTEIDGLLAAGRTPIVVGGTGLYLRAALADLDLDPPPPPELRARLQGELATLGVATLHARLAAVAPDRAARVAPTDATRVIRGLELHEMGVAPRDPSVPSALWTTRTRHPTRLLALTRDRADLLARIDRRVDAMVAAGAEAEVRAADRAGASPTARAALGFAELLTGDVEAMRTRTRRYAKRQLTWLRKLPGIEAIDLSARGDDLGALAGELLA